MEAADLVQYGTYSVGALLMLTPIAKYVLIKMCILFAIVRITSELYLALAALTISKKWL